MKVRNKISDENLAILELKHLLALSIEMTCCRYQKGPKSFYTKKK